MRRPFALLFALCALMAVACGSGNEAEVAELQMILTETQDRLAAAEMRMATCDCPEDTPAPPTPMGAAPTAPAAPDPTTRINADPIPAGEGPAELEVKAMSTVKVLVDGKGVSYNFAKSAYIKKDISPGPHLVEVQGAGTRVVVWSDTIDFPAGTRMRYQHKLGKRTLQPLGSVPVKQ